MSVNVPLLFLVFNRPQMTARVFERIRKAEPPRLYVAADGPRAGRIGEPALCEEVRRIATNIDWPCELITLLRSENLGCRRAVSGALDWFFRREPEGIVLEDDCLPDESFFEFCEVLLGRYRDDNRVMAISGNHLHQTGLNRGYSYVFSSRYNQVWGWASWRRAWQHYDHEMAAWPGLRETDWLKRIGDGHVDFERYWRWVFDMAYSDQVDSWAYRWAFSCWLREGLVVVPARNLVTNIGFGADATHTTGAGGRLDRLPLERMDFPLHHPPEVAPDLAVDRAIDLEVYRTNTSRFARRVRTMLGPVRGKVLGLLGRAHGTGV